MHRIDADANVANQFSAGNSSIGQPGTVVSADWLNAVQEEIAGFIELMGITLVKATNTQLGSAVMALLARVSTWTARQTFNGGCTVPASTPGSSDAARRSEVDAHFPVVRASLATVGQQVSASSGPFTTASGIPVDVTNLSVSITTTGRPVVVAIQPDGGASDAYFAASSTSGTPPSLKIVLLRGSTVIARNFLEVAGMTNGQLFSPAALFLLDTPAAGTYTYKVQVELNTGNMCAINNVVLVAYEL